jgi:hypothetical protein
LIELLFIFEANIDTFASRAVTLAGSQKFNAQSHLRPFVAVFRKGRDDDEG